MRYFERSGHRESLDAAIASVAQTYGFSAPPLVIPKKDAGDAGSGIALVALMTEKLDLPPVAPPNMPLMNQGAQAWGLARAQGGTAIVFAIVAPRHAIAQAFVVQSALSTAEAAGYTDLAVLVSSVGDHDSRKRYAHELGNFFRKHAKDLPEDIRDSATKDVSAAARSLADAGHPLAESLPKTIDYLSEASRKVMLETISLFEALNLRYELAPRLPSELELSRELVFAIEGTDRKGVRTRVASGGRIGDAKPGSLPPAVGMAVALPESVNARDLSDAPAPICYVVHVGEAAKLKAFGLLNALWHSHIALDQALLATSIQEQMQKAHSSGAKYLAIVGQREALDNTVILRNVATQIQETVPFDRVVARLARIKV
jgi:histidyl-tRNA synthetase